MADIFFQIFEQDHVATVALVPAVQAVLDESAGVAERSAAIVALRADLTAADAALRSISDDDADRLRVACVLLDAALAEPAAPDVVALASSAVEAALLAGDQEVAGALAARALATRPDEVSLVLLRANVEANAGRFDPDAVLALVDRATQPGLRRRLYANVGVALLATGRVREGLAAWKQAAMDASVLMAPDVAVFGHGQDGALAWIQHMRNLLFLDGLGELAGTWGIGGPRMIVLLEGLAGQMQDRAAADLLRAEATERLRRGRAEFTVDPEQPDVTLEGLLLDAAEFAKQLGLAELASRLR
jgi:hypothetical protein